MLYNKQRLSYGMKFFITSGITRVLIILIILSCLWLVILWSFKLP